MADVLKSKPLNVIQTITLIGFVISTTASIIAFSEKTEGIKRDCDFKSLLSEQKFNAKIEKLEYRIIVLEDKFNELKSKRNDD